MECQECHERPATLHVKQVINGQETKVSMCETCAKKKGYITYPEEGYSLHDLLTGLFNFDTIKMTSMSDNQLNQVKELQCSKCGMTFSKFKQVGKFGCAHCYESFASKLEPIFRRVHSGNTKHFGKIPKRAGSGLQLKKQLKSYREELQQLIEAEAFEEAAKVRDKIKALEKGDKEPEAGDES
ncbi:UvrB/UvrC motif-containing protein [Oceanobacillus profundus]|uniref:UvrB/UvrC motif-containing protein n=1 Tax=Oceanobacillus TaxID=182709 RepID=UPI00203D7DE3|nr:UvrB/UvrC motif-containing protein [Oceanobacillus profundus]MBR3120177.1 UvrB/UvrC motif-containing protein [Oceanobacillus sp.]MCM3399697.1 UvrB/UvrC motif-containing protein [Oceanobacillus profundus]